MTTTNTNDAADTPEDQTRKGIENLVRTKGAKIDAEAFGFALIDQFGKEIGMAQELFKLYTTCDNAQLKARLLVAAMDFVGKLHHKSPPRPLQDNMSDDELKAALRDIAPGLLGLSRGVETESGTDSE